jgi:hypothetical protein
MKKIVLLSSLLFFFSLQSQGQPAQKEPAPEEFAQLKAGNIKKAAATQFQYFIIKKDDTNTYGYTIFADGNLYIQQNTIPAIAGTKGFADTTSAARIARLVIQKIKQGEMPPAITISDLKRSGIQ